jgi:ribosomal protein S27AE
MRCPNCGKDSALEVHADPIRCMDCDSVANISYCICENCSFTFRLNNGHYLDGGLPDENARRLQKAVENQIRELMEEDKVLEKMTLSEYIAQLHSCIRCGSFAVTHGEGEFSCAMCGFSWEA